jgi:hypothetical protein
MMRGLLVLLSIAVAAPVCAAGPRLKVSENKRFLVRDDGTPFFYLGDTAWELFHRLNREEALHYLKRRAEQGFTVIQAVALAEEDGLNVPNPYGHRPLIDHDPTRPDVKDGPENDYWDHVDYIVDRAAEQGLFIGFLPTWGDKWNPKWGIGPEIFTPENAEAYARWLGRRYREKPILWIVGGDRPIENDRHRAIVAAFARGLREGDGGAHLITFHPTGAQGSAQYFHDAEWLDFNMRQNGHTLEYNGRYEKTAEDYRRTPVKPVLDGEPIYEDHPVAFDAAAFGYSTANDVRRPLYWDLFAGACGHTYGNHSVWQFFSPRIKGKNRPLLAWDEALEQPGAEQMQHARWLLESRPYLTRIPDDSLLVPAAVPTAVPGAGRYRFTATRDADGRYAMVYVPVGRRFGVKTEVLSGRTLRGWWFDPRTGQARRIGEFEKKPVLEFTPPDKNEDRDWILVLDDAAQPFGPPGKRK